MKFITGSPYISDAYGVLEKYPEIKDNFHYEIRETGNKYYSTELLVEINTLEELMKFKKVTCNAIVIDEDNELTIYDGYIE